MAPATLQNLLESEAYERARQAALDARDLIAFIEARAWPIESVLLKGARLAQSVRADRVVQWLDWEMRGYNPADSDALDMLDQTFRRAAEDTAHALCEGLPVIEARMASLREEERRITDPHLSEKRFDAIRREISRLVAVRAAVLAMLHAFASHILAERAHLLEPEERRIAVPAPGVDVSSDYWSPESDEPVDLAGCLEALGAFIDGMDETEDDHCIVLEDETDALDALVEEDAANAASDVNAEPTDSSDGAFDDAAATEEATAVLVALMSDNVTEPEVEDEWDLPTSDETSSRPASDLSADILLSEADIEAIFAATEEDIADFEGNDGPVPAFSEEDNRPPSGEDPLPPNPTG